MTDVCAVVITAPDHEWLLEFARQLVTDRLCASAHNFTPIRSIYQWQGQVHDRPEGRISLHTRKTLVPEIVTRTIQAHPYQIPSISSRPIEDGNPDYLRWIVDETKVPG